MSLSEEKRKQAIAQRKRKPSPPRPLFIKRREPRDKLRERMTGEHADVLFSVESTLAAFDEQAGPIDDRVCAEALSLARRGRFEEPGAAGALAGLLAAARECIDASEALWIDALQTVEDSVKNHSECLPGERSYLDFLDEFLP